MSIVLADLTKTYRGQPVVDRVSLEIADGELFVLLGPSGSGKSTILRMIAGLVFPDAGRITLHGRDVTAMSPQQRNTGFVFQNYSLFVHMTVAENVEFGLSIRKVPRRERARKRDELLALVGLTGFAGRYPRQLSGGQQQRVAVARALAFEPAVLLLDEPLGALDVRIRSQLRQSLREIQRELKVTTVLVTHDQEEAFELADRIGVIERGRLLEVGRPADLYGRPKSEFVASFVGEANLFEARREEGQLRLGDLLLPLPEASPEDPDAHWAVLLRPERVRLGRTREDLADPVLGRGVIEEILDLGSTRRVRVRLDGIPGVFPLGKHYGAVGLPVRVVIPPREEGEDSLAIGEAVWVSAAKAHVLRRAAPRFLFLLAGRQGSEREGESSALALTNSLTAAMGANVEVLRLGGEDPRKQLGRTFAAERYELVIVDAENGREDRTVEIVGRCPYPALVLPEGRLALRRVLLCTAAGEPGKLDVFLGAEIARCVSARATLLYVDDPELDGGGAERGKSQGKGDRTHRTRPTLPWIQRHLDQGLQTLGGQGVPAESKVRVGPALSEILAEAAEGDYDLVVIGGHLRRTWFRRPDKDLTKELLLQAKRPVLIVKGPMDR